MKNAKRDGLDIFFHVLRFFAALQIFFWIFLLKWGIMGKIFWVQRNHFKWFLFETQNYAFVFDSRIFQLVIFTTLFRCCPMLWKSTLKNITLVDVVKRWEVQRWTSYEAKNIAKTTLKCLLRFKTNSLR